MEILIAFDIDGTLNTPEMEDSFRGTIPPELLEILREKGVHIAIVSPSPYYPKTKEGHSMFPRYYPEASNTYRHVNLTHAFMRYPNSVIKIYVDDLLANRAEADKAGFIFATPEQFMKMVFPNISEVKHGN